MDLSAFNAAPIAGWKTQFGTGMSAMTMAADGAVTSVRQGQGTANLALAAAGSGQDCPRADAAAAMELQSAGTPKTAIRGNGLAQLTLAALDSSVSPLAVRGAGAADLALQSAYGIPAPGLIPAGFVSNRADRITVVAQQDRRLVVPADPLAVRADSRRLPVSPDRRSA